MNRKIEILHLEDNPMDTEFVQNLLEKEKLAATLTTVRSRTGFLSALEQNRFDVILSDYTIPGFDGLSALQYARDKLPQVPFIFMSGTIGEGSAIEALKSGATDYVLKDRPARLVPAIRRALQEAEDSKKRHDSEELLREQAMLLDCAQDAICLHDMSHTILYWNRGAERLYGWTASEAVGHNANQLLFPADLTSPISAITGLLANGEWRGELQQVSKDSKPLTVDSHWTLLRRPDGQPKSVLLINTDISEKKRMELQLLRTQRLDSIGALAGGIAHDLNNSLTPVVIGINLIESEVTSEIGSRMVNVMRSSTQRSVEMVKQILSFARGVGGEHSVIHLPLLIKDLARLAEETFPRTIQITTSVSPDLAPILGNVTQLNQVLLNLCVNARDAMTKGGSLHIEAQNRVLDPATACTSQLRSGPAVLLTVSDTGIGMTPDILEHIFEPFFTTKTRGKGTGLGLSTALGIVKTHGGFIEASSRPGQGSTFNVYLPATNRSDASSGHPAPTNPACGHGELILLIDDEAAVLEVTRLTLESFGYQVVTARNGQEALALFQAQPASFHVVITDRMMPVMGGEDTIAAIRKINPKIKFIGISGLASTSQTDTGRFFNAEIFLRKPFTAAELLAALRRLLSDPEFAA